ncbi:MAG: glycosyltransferase family 2 protein [Gammaproteobacteria bacterium]|nr:glycosyltransferase family 2 protein [Gammaproteobacteria bacterium]
MTKTNSQIEIIMSTCNGALHIEAQLDSIIAQTHGDWRLLIRDDGSVDATLEIISAYADRYKDKITLLQDTRGNIGPCASFGVLLESTTAGYVALCDQDDVWLPDKLESQLRCIRDVEAAADENLPVLVHSDLRVVDESGSVVAESFWRYQKLQPSRMQTLPGLLVQNCVTGCATMINRPLIKLAAPIPEQAIMHDWWLALIAVSCGKVVAMQSVTLNYRQHGANQVGAKQWGWRHIRNIFDQGVQSMQQSLRKTGQQAEALLQIHVLNKEAKRLCKCMSICFIRGIPTGTAGV